MPKPLTLKERSGFGMYGWMEQFRYPVFMDSGNVGELNARMMGLDGI